MNPRTCAVFAVLALAAPAAAQAAPLTPAGVFLDADPIVRTVMIGLLVAAAAAVAVAVRKLRAGETLTGGSAFLRALRLAGPLLGLAGAAYVGLMFFIALSNFPTPTMRVLAPGVAEIVMVVLLGLLTGVVATVANWAVEARIDRAVLRV